MTRKRKQKQIGAAKSSGAEHQKAQQIEIAGRSFYVTKADAPTASNVLDPFAKQYGDELIAPPVSPAGLCNMLSNCDVMSQCIEAMFTNLHCNGYHFEYVPPTDEPDRDPDPADDATRLQIETLFRHPNAEDTWLSLKQKLEFDYWLMGYWFMEVVRDVGDAIREFYYVPGQSLRLSKLSPDSIEHAQWIRQGDEWTQIPRRSRFRRYCQKVQGKDRWFKQFGDPRSLHKDSGKFADDTGTARWPAEQEASEVIHFAHWSPNSVYGEPPWLSEILKIMGSSEANTVNYTYFTDKTIPPWVIMVSGGTLGESGEQAIKDYLTQEFKGSDNFHKVLLLQGTPFRSGDLGDEKPSPMKIEIQPLTRFMEKDALFQTYIANNAKAVRESFRLPPVLLGGAEEYSHAAVKTALTVTEQQVFGPQRRRHDELINHKILAAMEIGNWRFVTHGVSTSDDATIIEAMAKMPEAVPFGAAVKFISDLMGVDPPEIDPEMAGQTIGQIKSGREALRLQTALASRTRESDQNGEEPESEEETEKQLLKGLKTARDALLRQARAYT